MKINLGQMLTNRAFLSPDMEACVGADYRYTYAQANARANRFASALAAKDFKKGDRIAVLCKNNEHITCAVYGAAKIGVITRHPQLAAHSARAGVHSEQLRGRAAFV